MVDHIEGPLFAGCDKLEAIPTGFYQMIWYVKELLFDFLNELQLRRYDPSEEDEHDVR